MVYFSAHFDDSKPLEELEEEITSLAAHIHAATHRLLTLIAAFDRRQGWKAGGHRSCAHWLSFRTGIDLGACREKVRAARALTGLPEISASMAQGQISFSKVRALTRVANDANEGKLLDMAKECTAAQLEKVVMGVRRGGRRDEAALEQERYQSRCLSVFPDSEGMYVVRGRLPAEIGVLLMRAVEAASDALYREKGVQGDSDEDRVPGRTAAQRRADAMGLLAERALGAGLGGRSSGTDPKLAGHITDEDSESLQNQTGPQAREDPASTPVPVSGSRAERYQVVLYVEPETLRSDGEGGLSEMEDGTRVSAETSQRISCDAGLVRIARNQKGKILDVGRRTRTIPPAIRRALDARDGGCRFPGCGSRFAEGHHIHHWAEGGETRLDNLVLLSRYHHRLLHEGGWKVEMSRDGAPVFLDPRGRVRSERPPRIGRSRDRRPETAYEDKRRRREKRKSGLQQGSIFAQCKGSKSNPVPPAALLARQAGKS
ncbi:MAG: DUF222 domain-containing protein [Gemmatimonadota bacterium]|jgi:hypothetical protein